MYRKMILKILNKEFLELDLRKFLKKENVFLNKNFFTKLARNKKYKKILNMAINKRIKYLKKKVINWNKINIHSPWNEIDIYRKVIILQCIKKIKKKEERL